MRHPFLEETVRFFGRKPDENDAFLAFVNKFCDQSFFIPVKMSDPELASSQAGVAFWQEEGKTPSLPGYLNSGTVKESWNKEGLEPMQISGAFVIGIARKSRFDFVVRDDREEFVINYDTLLLFNRMLNLTAARSGEQPASLDQDVINRTYPNHFAKWLYRYCAGRPGIKRCWLGLVVVPGAAYPDVWVVLDDPGLVKQGHEEIKTNARQMLLPGQLVRLQDALGDRPGSVLQQIKSFPPFYDRRHKQDWWNRFKRRLRRVPVPCIQMQIEPDDERS